MVVGIGIIYQMLTDPIAVLWHVWFFSKDKTIGLWLFNFPVEETFFIILVTIAISSATLTFIHYQEKGKLKRLMNFKKQK